MLLAVESSQGSFRCNREGAAPPARGEESRGQMDERAGTAGTRSASHFWLASTSCDSVRWLDYGDHDTVKGLVGDLREGRDLAAEMVGLCSEY